MVPLARIELTIIAYQATVIPFNYRGFLNILTSNSVLSRHKQLRYSVQLHVGSFLCPTVPCTHSLDQGTDSILEGKSQQNNFFHRTLMIWVLTI